MGKATRRAQPARQRGSCSCHHHNLLHSQPTAGTDAMNSMGRTYTARITNMTTHHYDHNGHYYFLDRYMTSCMAMEHDADHDALDQHTTRTYGLRRPVHAHMLMRCHLPHNRRASWALHRVGVDQRRTAPPAA